MVSLFIFGQFTRVVVGVLESLRVIGEGFRWGALWLFLFCASCVSSLLDGFWS